MLRIVQDGDIEYQCLMFVCPGCALNGQSGVHMLPVNTDKTSPAWTWDGIIEAPTISPSILTSRGDFVCHSFLNQGIFQFLPDCTHELKGQEAAMPDLPNWVFGA